MSEDQVGSDCVWTRFDPVQGGLMILLLPLTHVPLTVKQYWDHWQCEHSYSVIGIGQLGGGGGGGGASSVNEDIWLTLCLAFTKQRNKSACARV